MQTAQIQFLRNMAAPSAMNHMQKKYCMCCQWSLAVSLNLSFYSENIPLSAQKELCPKSLCCCMMWLWNIEAKCLCVWKCMAWDGFNNMIQGQSEMPLRGKEMKKTPWSWEKLFFGKRQRFSMFHSVPNIGKKNWGTEKGKHRWVKMDVFSVQIETEGKDKWN